ncbi:MAG: signal peptidase II [Prevotella sp.]|nr:signal peptidase II [Prevotella sp.]MCM1075543.1 signal peptidase II [Ruminococcus sp.]
MKNRKGLLALIIIVCMVVIDQIVKIYVKTHFYLGEDYEVASWFQIKFIQNPGMAFGIELWSKMLLTLGRMAAVAFFIWFIMKAKSIHGLRTGFIITAALITAGAAGNIFDCVFYGEIFNNPAPPAVAHFVDAGGGYAGWFEGQVVDMFYFPIFTINIAGHSWEFFQYIFNVADACICVGVFMLIFFYTKDLSFAWESITGKKKQKDAEGK